MSTQVLSTPERGCAQNRDGTLKDALDIKFFYSPSEETGILSQHDRTLSKVSDINSAFEINSSAESEQSGVDVDGEEDGKITQKKVKRCSQMVCSNLFIFDATNLFILYC